MFVKNTNIHFQYQFIFTNFAETHLYILNWEKQDVS